MDVTNELLYKHLSFVKLKIFVAGRLRGQKRSTISPSTTTTSAKEDAKAKR